ncbi:MAG: hypothetical protein U0Q11_11555 [Vicinamibacterales bacterium]
MALYRLEAANDVVAERTNKLGLIRWHEPGFLKQLIQLGESRVAVRVQLEA